MKFYINKALIIILVVLAQHTLYAQKTILPQQNDRWSIQHDGSIAWDIKDRLPHADHIEMSGEKVSLWIAYSVDTAGISKITRTVVFPTFRMLPDDTRSHIAYTFDDNELPRIYINNQLLRFDISQKNESGGAAYQLKGINQHGVMRMSAQAGNPPLVKIERSLFPSVDKPLAIERFEFSNISNKPVTISIENLKRKVTTDTLRSKSAPHTVIMESVNDGSRILQPGQSTAFAVCYRATDHPLVPVSISPEAEEKARMKRIAQILSPLQLITPDSILNTEFAFAKIRGTESIFKTKGGYMHGPGGLSYYAAIWANDQAEYISPFFAFSGDSIGNLSAMNCYRMFARYMNPQYEPLPSSIVAEGDTVWKGAGDRGDQAMIAYGASRYALANGNADSAKVLWPLISWCLEYSRRHINNNGVVESKSDELEGRFPSGKANLSTNSLYYDALVSAALLGKQLQIPKKQTDAYTKQATELKNNIEKYFGANVDGFETYKYYETNNVLRAWICMPLTMGIYNRSKGTIDALFSPRLWTADGLATEAGKDTFWDRSTLYALRGVLQAGATERAMTFLHYYSRRRLLGEHVPYPVEAYPEGNQRHLSAESGLYCRIFTEGLFGMRPTGFNSFDCTPRLPKGWNEIALNNIHSFGAVFDLKVVRQSNDKVAINIITKGTKHTYTAKEGETVHVLIKH
ncbi:hypothetical protein SNE25_19170 [Mucilaginibacter sabulilitoris]|uniref:Six-hairpin glycosidase-like protein n=1 Tax=Mucilaginibacter sabulilitoris TaxID=1173583 RepID=A0ABZ0TE14_9SPHI|nr:hypothetical protein [Mucilaginibacter sabulilitoris]WPU91442.1 hypothetical protein SNE25_19170 [Mucilaginibacter sabulilitoris]